MSSSLIEQVRRLASRPANESFSLPPACYTDSSFFCAEIDKVFAREWWCIGRVADIPAAGDYLTMDTPHAQVMAVRQHDRTIKTFSRVCRHRGALLGSDGGGNAPAFVCPYHSWTYTLDGRLRHAAAMNANAAYDREACSLPVFRTETWQGFIFFTTNPDAEPLAPRLEPITQRAWRYRLDELRTAFVVDDVWNTNWKVAFENGSESYHHLGVHRETLQPYFPALGVICEPGGDAYSLHVVPTASGFSLGSNPADANGALTATELTQFLIVGIYPGLALVFSGPSVVWFSFTPIDVTRTRLRVGWLAPEQYFTRENAAESMAYDRARLESILAEDKVSCASVQRGLSARDAAPGPLSQLELPIADFTRYLARCLSR